MGPRMREDTGVGGEILRLRFAQNDMWVEEQGMGRTVREPSFRGMWGEG